MAERTFFVRNNVDEMAIHHASLDSMDEKADWFDGYMVGVRGITSRPTWSASKTLGHSFGMQCWEEAEAFRAVQAEKSAAGVQARDTARAARKSGKADPDATHGLTPGQPVGIPVGLPVGLPSQQSSVSNNKEESFALSSTPSPAANVVEIWNAGVQGSGLPAARPSPKRSRIIAARLRERGWIDDFKAAVAFVAKDEFYRGAGKRSWIATLDYLLQPGKATELAERSRATPVAPDPAAQPRASPKPSAWVVASQLVDLRSQLADAKRRRATYAAGTGPGQGPTSHGYLNATKDVVKLDSQIAALA